MHVVEWPAVAPRIESAPTATTGFVGTFPSGPAGRPITVHSFAQFTQQFGARGVTTDTSIAVQDFFAHGGSQAVIVAVGEPEQEASSDELVRGVSLLSSSAGQAPPVQLLCVPDMARTTQPFSNQQYDDLLLRITGFCVQHRIFLIVDPNVTGHGVGDIERWIQQNASWGSSNSAVYFPRLHTAAGKAAHGRPVAASGAVAGVMARTDSQRGVWKAPAGVEAAVHAQVATALSDREQSPLNRHGINVIRHMQGLGTVIWGARTGVGSIGNEFRYIPVRRTALFVEHSLHQGLQWAVFEPNAEPLWQQITTAVSDFLTVLWRQGAFPGATQDEAFFVRCDATTMTRVDLRRRRTVIHVGFAAQRPAEFVVLQVVLERV